MAANKIAITTTLTLSFFSKFLFFIKRVKLIILVITYAIYRAFSC